MTTINIMIDLETWGKKPGFDLRSIGATVFDPSDGTVGIPCPACKGGTGNVNEGGDCSDCLNTRIDQAGQFYIATDNPLIGTYSRAHYSQSDLDKHGGYNRRYVLDRDPETVDWWHHPDQAQAAAAFTNPVDLHDALTQFADWLCNFYQDGVFDQKRDATAIALWSHGPAFDVAILAAAYDAVGLPVPWHYRAPRDTRTCFDMAGISDHSLWLQQYNHGTAHNALDDAIAQAGAVCGAWQRLGAQVADAAKIIASRQGKSDFAAALKLANSTTYGGFKSNEPDLTRTVFPCSPDNHYWEPGAEGAFAGLSEHCTKCGLER
jgi:hypothetical protein